MTTFLSDIVLAGANDIQFKNTAGANTGKIESDGNNLVLSNAVGDVLLGDGASDVYIGDGTNNVDILFEQSGSISAESGAELTLGNGGGTLALGSAISSATTILGDLTVGVDDTGHDVTFFGATSGKKMLWDQSADTLIVDGTLDVNGDATVITGAGSGSLTVGRNANENMVIYVDDSNTTITGVQDSDTNSAHSFILNRTFLGSGANNFIIQKGGTAQLTLDTNSAATFAGTIGSGAITSTGSIITSSSSGVIQTPKISMEADGTLDWGAARDYGTLTWDTGYALIRGQSGKGIIFGTNGSTTALTLDTSQNATFAGKVITTEVESAGALLLDAAADITIDAGGGDIILSDDATIFGTISSGSGSNIQIRSRINNADMFLRGVDDGTEFNALTLDMSDAGTAIFNHNVNLPDSGQLNLGASGDLSLLHDGTDGYITEITGDLKIGNTQSNKDIIFYGNDGGSTITALTLDMSAAGAATFAGTVTGTTLTGTSLDINGNADISGDLTGVDTLTATTLSVTNYGLASGDIPNNAANTTGTAAGLSATLAIASGGTAATNSNGWLNSRITTSADGSLNYDAASAVAVNHDSLAGFVAAEHVDWAASGAGTIHTSNYIENVVGNLGVTANGTSLTVTTTNGTNIAIPAATTSAWGVMTDEMFDTIAANTVKGDLVVEADESTKGLIEIATVEEATEGSDGTKAVTAAGLKAHVENRKVHELAAPTAALAMNSQKITGVSNPTAAQDVATKAYVDGARVQQIVNLKGYATLQNDVYDYANPYNTDDEAPFQLDVSYGSGTINSSTEVNQSKLFRSGGFHVPFSCTVSSIQAQLTCNNDGNVSIALVEYRPSDAAGDTSDYPRVVYETVVVDSANNNNKVSSTTIAVGDLDNTAVPAGSHLMIMVKGDGTSTGGTAVFSVAIGLSW